MPTPTIEITLPPVPSAQIFTDKTGILTQPAQQWLVNLRDKVNAINAVVIAISGAGTPIGAFNALSPLTTNGDLLTYSSGTNVRLPIGTNGQVLTVVSGMPAWAAGGGGSSPLTTKGDIYGYSTVPARIPVGTDGQVLTSRSSNANGVDWETPSSAGSNYIIPTFANVSSLLHFNGTNGSTTFTDQVAGNTWTANNATISTAQSLFGGASGYFSGGSNSSIHMPTNSGFNVGSGNFTLEFAVYYAALPQNSMHLFQTRDGDVYSGISIEGNAVANNNLYLYMSSAGTSFDILNNILIGTVPSAKFTRFLIQRAGTILTVYQDGFLTYTANIGTVSVYYNSSDLVVLGGNYTGVSRSLNGYIDEFRFTNGQALVAQYLLTTSEFPNS